MVIVQDRSLRKPSGARYKDVRTKRLAQKGGRPSLTKLGDSISRPRRTRGGNKKFTALSVDKANVLDPKSKKTVVVAIKTIKENPANRHYVRRNILSKGAVIETDKGLAKVTNRPGQEGFVNAILLK